MKRKINFKLFGYKPYDCVWFFPYTTDSPQIKRGQILQDDEGLFIAYDVFGPHGSCDDGECVICTTQNLSNDVVQNINNSLQLLENKYIDEIRELKARIKELEGSNNG